MNTPQHDLYQKIKQYTLRHVRDRQDAEDIVQDVFVKVQTQQQTLRDSEKLVNWTYRITKNAITDYYRHKKKEQVGVLVDGAEDRHVFNECVEHCLTVLSTTLPSPYKEALELSEGQNISQTELAQHWGISYSGAKSRVQRARQMLKKKMETLYNIKADAYGNIIVCEDRIPCGCDVPQTLREELNQL